MHRTVPPSLVASSLAVALLVGCTDYGFHGKPGDPNKPWDTASDTALDTSAPIVDTGGTPGETGPAGDTTQDTGPYPDTSHSDTGQPTGDTAPPTTTDGCYEPDGGYASNPAARIFTTDSTSKVKITFIESSTDYQDVLYEDSPEVKRLITAYTDTPGKILRLGPYPTDTELIFGIDVLSTGDHYQSGPSTRNSDGVAHVAVTYLGSCTWQIGFEDLNGGGDRDYNDVVMQVSGMLKEEL